MCWTNQRERLSGAWCGSRVNCDVRRNPRLKVRAVKSIEMVRHSIAIRKQCIQLMELVHCVTIWPVLLSFHLCGKNAYTTYYVIYDIDSRSVWLIQNNICFSDCGVYRSMYTDPTIINSIQCTHSTLIPPSCTRRYVA